MGALLSKTHKLNQQICFSPNAPYVEVHVLETWHQYCESIVSAATASYHDLSNPGIE